MNRREQVQRDHRLAAEAAAGASQAELARRFNISERTVRRALGKVRESGGAASFDRLADRHQQLEVAIEDLAYARTAAGNPRTRVAAIRLQAQLMKDQALLALDEGLRWPNGRARDDAVRAEFSSALLALATSDEVDPGTQRWLEEATNRLQAERRVHPETGHP